MDTWAAVAVLSVVLVALMVTFVRINMRQVAKRKQAELAASMPALEQPIEISEEIEIIEEDPAEQEWREVEKRLRSWAISLAVLGAIHMISAGFLNAPWGILLMVTAALTYYFRTVAMFPVFATTIGWASISNLLGGGQFWSFFAFLQIFWTFTTFRDFWRNRHVKSPDPELTHRAEVIFPWIGAVLGVSALLTFLIIIGGFFLFSFLGLFIPPIVGVLEVISLYVGVMAAGMGIGVWFQKGPMRGLGMVGMVTGLLRILGFFGLWLLDVLVWSAG